MIRFSKTTIIGGVLFLVPFALVLWILNHALQLTAKVSRPISKGLHLDQLGEWSGIGAATVIAVLVLVLISFAAGVLARTGAGRWISRSLERSLLGGMPQYRLVKNMVEGLAQIESAHMVKPVLVNIDPGWQIGYLLEPLENGWVAVFLPQAPSPMSGSLVYFPSDRVRPLQATMLQAMNVVKHLGTGSGELLRGIDLSMPRAS